MDTTDSITVDGLIEKLVNLRNQSQLKGETVVYVCQQGVPYVPIKNAILETDKDGAVVLMITEPEQP